jgi:PAS domain S-box-containing protein
LIVTDLEGRIIFLNEEAHKYFRCPKEEIIGENIVSLFEEKASYEKLYNEVVSRGLEIARYKTVFRNPLGEMLPSLINANVLKDDLGSLIGIIFIIRDIQG